MKLLIMVINKTDSVADIVNVLVELDVRGITGGDSEGMMRLLSEEVPLFAGLRDLVSMPRSYSKIIFGITESDHILKELYETLKSIGIDVKSHDFGYLFTIPVNSIVESPGE